MQQIKCDTRADWLRLVESEGYEKTSMNDGRVMEAWQDEECRGRFIKAAGRPARAWVDVRLTPMQKRILSDIREQNQSELAENIEQSWAAGMRSGMNLSYDFITARVRHNFEMVNSRFGA